jgi:hypothetical protein
MEKPQHNYGSPVWRYLSLAKYIDLLRTRSLYFPKASLFQDETEGKWWGHAHLYENAEKWRHSPDNVRILEGILQRAGEDHSKIISEINGLSPTPSEWVRNILNIAWRAYPHKRREYLESVITSWKRQYADHNKAVEQWKADMSVLRESTYISCWNGAASMSLAMWEMYGGGRESIALRSSRDKLSAVIKENAPFLDQHCLEGSIADVEYIPGLKCPNEEAQERIYEILFERERDYRVGLFAIKPSIYEFEQEVRALIYPKRNAVEPLKDPHPHLAGFQLSITERSSVTETSIANFIEKIHVHPMLDQESMMVQTVKEINSRFGAPEIPVEADRIEAMGPDILLP